MKKALMLAVVLVLVSSMAFAQGGMIAPYMDTSGTDCDYADVGFAIISVEIVQTLAPAASASGFMAVNNSALVPTGSTIIVPLSIGDPWTGLNLSYGGCLASPIHLVSLSMVAQGLSAPCSSIDIVPDPAPTAPGYVESIDCAGTSHIATGGQLIVNDDGTCPCGVPTEDSSWGQIKALYNN